ncbi:hypothetical protein AMTRI_Chr09g33290 [Amborella trichopoda]
MKLNCVIRCTILRFLYFFFFFHIHATRGQIFFSFFSHPCSWKSRR